MGNPILYCEGFPDLAAVTVGSVAVLADDGTATHLPVLTTAGGLFSLTVSFAGSGLTPGTYVNVGVQNVSGGKGSSGTVTVVVNGDGTVHAAGATSFIPGFGYSASQLITVPAASIGGTGTPPQFLVASIVPCSAPFPSTTKYVEFSCDVGGPAWITIDSTLSSMGVSNGLFTTQQSTFSSTSCRINANERLVRRVPFAGALPVPGAGGAGFKIPLSYQVIMGTASA